ncbi:hypothetical protein JNA64_05680 [Pseudomonas stutzeri]|uniref:hypothetical protein n=1 Tax=Stutzerimonas stutzeri TaxID=316 RepID=UPI001F518024|nr:hypothetical protein [Stutzerimonas stutzeri]MCI0916650.1 hypothetical protein [Stutzerimonas stutzeri]
MITYAEWPTTGGHILERRGLQVRLGVVFLLTRHMAFSSAPEDIRSIGRALIDQYGVMRRPPNNRTHCFHRRAQVIA